MTKYHYLSRKACTKIALASLSVTVVALFVVLAVTLSSTSNNIRSSKASFSFPKDLPSEELQYAIVDRFFGSDANTDDDEQQYWDAKGAMENMISDGEPVPIHGMDGLFIGGVGAAYNYHALKENGITHIISLDPAAYCLWPDEFHCLHITTLNDNQKLENSIDQYFPQLLPIIDDALASGGKMLVHCWAGVSRSSSIIAAYLIKHEHVTRDEALEQIRINRPQARPNKLYMTQLEEFHEAQMDQDP